MPYKSITLFILAITPFGMLGIFNFYWGWIGVGIQLIALMGILYMIKKDTYFEQ